jgi:hypothetical protein
MAARDCSMRTSDRRHADHRVDDPASVLQTPPAGLYSAAVGSRRRRRRMVADGALYGWCFGHWHDRARGYLGCKSTVTLWRPESRARLRLVFRPGPGRAIADGYFDEGAVVRLPDRAHMNLHEPGSVRALLDEALARGLFPVTGAAEADGWPLFDAVTPQDPTDRPVRSA